MGTSLTDQLRRLAVPQTSLLSQDKKRPSLLFDPREAANLDRETFYELGLSGLNELKNLHHRFAEFEHTLFNLSSISLERSVESKESNAKLDRNIKKFLLLLSPYFLLKPSHKALEWLINRFHIHEYNVDELMMLILPYHETRIFVRVLQLVDVSDPAGRWHWLHPLQKPGVVLAKGLLLKRCSRDVAMLKFVADATLAAVKELKTEAGALSTLFAFYCTTLVGALEGSKTVTELQLTHLIKSVLRGLTSPVQEFCAAAMMVTAQISRKTQLSKELLFNIINRTIKCPGPELSVERVSLLVLLYQNQDELRSSPVPPPGTVGDLSRRPWFAASLGEVGLKGAAHVSPLVSAVLAGVLRDVLGPEGAEGTGRLRAFAVELLLGVTLEAPGAEEVVRCVVHCTELYCTELSPHVQDWCSDLIGRLERQYPAAFDTVVREAAREGRPPLPLLSSGLQTATRLNHPDAEIRAQALGQLASTYDALDETERLSLAESIGARLADDSPEVVRRLLQTFSTPALLDIIGEDGLNDRLMALLGKCWRGKEQWEDVVCDAIAHLSYPNTSSFVDARLLVAVFPFLLPGGDREVQHARAVLASDVGKSNALLLAVGQEGRAMKTAPQICQSVMDTLSTELLPPCHVLREVIDTTPEGERTPVFVFAACTLLVGSLPENAGPEVAGPVAETIFEAARGYRLETVPKISMAKCVAMLNSRRSLPSRHFFGWLAELVRKTAVGPDVLDSAWWDVSEMKRAHGEVFLANVFDNLLAGSAEASRKTERAAYQDALGGFLDAYCPALPARVVFLCRRSVMPGAGAKTRVRCLRLAASLLAGAGTGSVYWAVTTSQRTVVPSLVVAARDTLHAVRVAAVGVLERLSGPHPSTLLAGTRLAARSYVHLVDRLLERREEITAEADQMGLALYTALSPDPTVQAVFNSSPYPDPSCSLDALLACAMDPETPGPVCSGLLSALHLVTSPEMTARLAPLGSRLLSIGRADGRLDPDRSTALRLILDRLTGPSLSRPECWALWEAATLDHSTRLERPDGKSSVPALLALECVTQRLFESAGAAERGRLLSALLSAGTDTDQTEVVSATARAFRRLSLDAGLAVGLLEEMRDAKNPDPPGGKGRNLRRFVANVAPNAALLHTPAWRRGTTLLELLQGKKKLRSTEALLPCLFALLKKCLQFEEQAPVEYTKQLLLSLLLHCCQKLSEEGPLPPGVTFDAELVVECVRATQNPQTHHHVLLLLSHVARLCPRTVLHNVMAVFTFMGSSVLRQDDAYSFQVISQIIDSVVPTLVHSEEWSKVSTAVCGILRVFVDALLDIPEHRRLRLFEKLLTTLDAKNSLWILLCLVVESHVMHGGAEAGSKTSQRLEFAQSIAQRFPPEIVFASCVNLLQYIQSLPTDKEDSGNARKSPSKKHLQVAICGVTGLFDVERNSAKQLRHLKYALTAFLASLLASPPFVLQAAQLSEDDTMLLEPHYRALITNLLDYIRNVTREVDASHGKVTGKYWRVMLNQGYDILDKVNALLPIELFLAVTCGLLKHELLPIQRKALELFNTRLQHQPAVFTSCRLVHVFNVMPMLIGIISTIREVEDKRSTGIPTEGELIQQTALLSVKLLARTFGAQEPGKFRKVLTLVTRLVGSRLQSGPVFASVLLCLAELCGALRAYAIPSLADLVPPLVGALKAHTGSADIMILSTVTAVHKVVEALPNFLSPYLDKLLYHVAILSAGWRGGDDSRAAPVLAKLSAIEHNMAASIPPRVLVPAVGRCYAKLVERGEYNAVGPVLGVLSDSFRTLSGSELVQLQPELMAVLLRALDARVEVAGAGLEVAAEVEGHAVRALVAFVLKLSESAFRPLYYSLFHWATEASAHADRAITFYRLSSTIAESLKGLFVLFAGHFLKNAAALLEKTNTTKSDSPVFPADPPAESEQKAILLLRYILETLHCVFLYDSGTFVNKERFDSVMQPIVDQLENTLGGTTALDERVKKLLTPCIAQLAAASADDILWKQLNYQVLLKARHNSPQVRLAALATLCAMATKLGEDFLPLLPETIPFLAELMEDEDETVERTAQAALQDLEAVLGEPLQKYF